MKGAMTLEEFFDKLYKDNVCDDLIVRLAYKYDHEKDYTFDNELLLLDGGPCSSWSWWNDWNEGQQNVWVLGYLTVSEVQVSMLGGLNG